jgi:hypothetical protein
MICELESESGSSRWSFRGCDSSFQMKYFEDLHMKVVGYIFYVLFMSCHAPFCYNGLSKPHFVEQASSDLYQSNKLQHKLLEYNHIRDDVQ